jgi:hypothetical protein
MKRYDKFCPIIQKQCIKDECVFWQEEHRNIPNYDTNDLDSIILGSCLLINTPGKGAYIVYDRIEK